MTAVRRLAVASRELIRSVVPRRILRRLRPGSKPRPGRVDFGDLRATRPISSHFGFERGLPVDRWYIERFLGAHAVDIRGRVLEAGDAAYTRRFGGARVTRSDVLHVVADAPGATIIGDLADAPQIPDGIFDCIVLTQTLHLVYDVRAAISTIRRILAPGGVVLLTVPGISQIDTGEWRDTWYWGFTERSVRRLFSEAFGDDELEVEAVGNVLAAVSFLEGIASEELRPAELAANDRSYPVCILVRATKRPSADPTAGPSDDLRPDARQGT